MKRSHEACTVPGCGREHFCKGFCVAHYWRNRNGKPMEPPVNTRQFRSGTPCLAFGCSRPAKAKGLCNAHYNRRAHGHPDWAGFLRKHDKRKRGYCADVRLDLIAKLDAQAKARRIPRRQLLEAILEEHFRDELASERRVA